MRFLIAFLLLMASTAHAGLLDSIGGKQAGFLPPDEAFGLQIVVHDNQTLQASFRITPGYYLYRDKTSFRLGEGVVGRISEIMLPPGEVKDDPNFGPTEVYHQSFQAELQLADIAPGKPLVLKARYQGCSEDGLCYPPIDKSLTVTLASGLSNPPPAALQEKTPVPENDNTRIAGLFEQGSFWLILSFFFGAGLLLAFTPCVFPMIPILSGIIVGRGHNITHAHAFLLSLAYVLGMALTYAAAGVAAGFSGSLISNALQTPWVLGSFAGLFVILSLSMFGLYELQLPSALQSRLTNTSNKLHGGHISGVFAMGALSALIMGPCVAAPLAGALLYIGQTHDAVLGGSALFALALGMGAPLLLIGSSAAVWLPKAGSWMEAVKRFFGVIMLALAIWIIHPLIPVSVQMLLWAALLIFSAIYLRALDPLPPNAHPRHKLLKGLAILLLLLGAAYLIGGLSGARDILRPLGELIDRPALAKPAHNNLRFERVRNSAELDARLAGAAGKTVMLDFYADWCASCKEMERFTFSDPAVQARLANSLLLQVDVTENNDGDKALLQRYGLFGPPATLFFNAQGQELTDHRVTGYQNAEDFLASLKAAGL